MLRRFDGVALLIAVIFLNGCSNGLPEGAGDTPAMAPSHGDQHAPTFTGPYAQEFTDAFLSSQSDFARSVLTDGDISDGEYAEMTQRFDECLRAHGLKFSGFAPDGAYTLSGSLGSDAQDVVTGCSEDSGEDVIGALRTIMQINPNNEDIGPLMVACLIRSGSVSSDYSLTQYTIDNNQLFGNPEALGTELRVAYETCSLSPTTAYAS